MKWRRILAAATILALVGLVVGVAVVLEARLQRPYQGYDLSAPVVIESGMTARAVARRLAAAGVVEQGGLFTAWLWWTGQTGSIHAGEYRFSQPKSMAEVAEIITTGRVVMHSVTVPEGSTRWQVARAIAAAGFGSYEEALSATADIDLIRDLDPQATSLEGYLYPDTYMAAASEGADDLVAAMVKRFRNLWTADITAAAREIGLSLHEVVILASLIEAETPSAQERPLVSAVFHNRLGRGMLLQTDPTVLYAMRLAGRDERTIRRSDLQRDSPYNTYRYAGLPPGPIGNPRATSIDAALHPAHVDWLYFVSRNDGTHAFSRTLGEHNRMVNQYQRQP